MLENLSITKHLKLGIYEHYKGKKYRWKCFLKRWNAREKK